MRAMLNEIGLQWTAAHIRIAELERENNELRADAERYRWLRANKLRYNGTAWHWHPSEPLFEPNLDAAIDAARAR